MTEASPANLELAIALPLGVVANQLMRIETDLRFLNMKASAYASELENGNLAAKIAGGLERINEALDLIRGLVADMEANIQPTSASQPDTSSSREPARKLIHRSGRLKALFQQVSPPCPNTRRRLSRIRLLTLQYRHDRGPGVG